MMQSDKFDFSIDDGDRGVGLRLKRCVRESFGAR